MAAATRTPEMRMSAAGPLLLVFFFCAEPEPEAAEVAREGNLNSLRREALAGARARGPTSAEDVLFGLVIVPVPLLLLFRWAN